MATRTVNLRIREELMQYLEKKTDTSVNQLVNDIIERIQRIEKYADRDIMNVFTPQEWEYMADSLNGTLVEGDFRYYAQALIAGLEDSAKYDGLDKKWDVDVNTLSDKVSKLSSSAIEAIHRRIEAFWEDSTQDLEEWAKY